MYSHLLIENKQFLLLIDIPIQDRVHQITVHQVFTFDIPYGNYSAHYDINTKYFGVTKDATMVVELSTTQFQICQQTNGQFCHISTPFQLLANPPMCIAALYTKSKAGIASKCSLQLCKTTTTVLPTQITPDVWILTTPATAPLNTVTLICPENFPTVPLDDEHWTSEIVPDGTFCIHKNGLPNNVCQHPCPYGNNDTFLHG